MQQRGENQQRNEQYGQYPCRWPEQEITFEGREEELLKMVKGIKESAVGPDGLPYKLWKVIAPLVATHLLRCAEALVDPMIMTPPAVADGRLTC